MSQQKSLLKSFFAALTLSFLCLFCGGPVLATTSASVQAVAQSYGSSTSLADGTVVKISNQAHTQVNADTYATSGQMLGVVVNPASAPVTLTSTPVSGSQVYVASSGRYDVLVSNQNGVINIGDYITTSSLSGVGMKVGGQTEVLGKAASAFDGHRNVQRTVTVRDPSGRSVKVAVGLIAVDLAVGPNPSSNKDGAYVPRFLQQTVSVVSSQPVSAWRIYLSLLVLLIATLTGASLLYGGVRSGMTAIGRNPLARGSITRNLLQIIITSILIFVVGLFATYIMLRV